MTDESKPRPRQAAPLWPVEVTLVLALFLGSLAYGASTNGWTWAFLVVASAGAVIAAAALQSVKWLMQREREGLPPQGPPPPPQIPGDVTAFQAAGRLLNPTWSLIRSLLPLFLPSLVIVLFMTRNSSWIVQGIAGAALITVVWLFLVGDDQFHEWKAFARLWTIGDALRGDGRWRGIGLLVGVAAVTTVAFGYLAQASFSDWLHLAGGSGVLEWLALLFVTLAFFARLAGWITDWLRRVAAVALVALVAQLFAVEGVFRRFHPLDTIGFATFGALSAVLVFVFVGALVAEAIAKADGPRPGPFYQSSRAIGFGAAGFSAFLLLFSLCWATAQTTGGSDAIGKVRATLAPQLLRTGRGSDGDLAMTFAPVLHVEYKEQYPPAEVGDFLIDATQSGAVSRGRPGAPLDRQTLPTACFDGGHDACGTLSCDSCETPTSPPERGSWVREGVLYARVVHRRENEPAFAGWSPWVQLQTLIQYWVFYRYDRWQTETLLGDFTQEHQGDWEYVTVGLDGSNRPIFLALSAHCAGGVVLWDDDVPAVSATYDAKRHRLVVAPGSDVRPATVSHPIIAVARGSHANYVDNGGHRPPDFGSCAHVPADAVLALSYASNVRDLTSSAGGGWFAYPADVDVVPSDRGRLGFPFNYPGTWGTGEYITIGHRETYRDGDAPRSPPLQGGSWDTPVHLYACGSYWQRPRWTGADCDEWPPKPLEEKMRSALSQIVTGILLGDRAEEILAQDSANPH